MLHFCCMFLRNIREMDSKIALCDVVFPLRSQLEKPKCGEAVLLHEEQLLLVFLTSTETECANLSLK